MRSQTLIVSLVSTAWLAAAVPAPGKSSGLRLIKTSPSDPGTWVSDEDKITKYVAKDIGFIDITDITVRFCLLSEMKRETKSCK